MSKVLAVLLELKECSDYWSDYAVPIGIHERIDAAIAELLAQPEPELNQESRSKPFRGLELNGDSYPPEYIEESPMYDMTIHDNPDALAWTRFFMETYPACNVDDQTMFGWFANAMRAMYDHTCRNTSLPKREPLSDIEIRSGYNANLHMTMRDHFAGLAMQVLLVDATSMYNVASNAYDMADAMLKAR